MLETFPFTLPSPSPPSPHHLVTCILLYFLMSANSTLSISLSSFFFSFFTKAPLSAPSTVHFLHAPSSLPESEAERWLMSHHGSRLIHFAPGSHLPGEITSRFNRTYVSNSLNILILTHARVHAHTLGGLESLMATFTQSPLSLVSNGV